MSESLFDQFRQDVEFMWRRSTSSWGAQMMTNGLMTREELGMVTLQMYHYVKDTVKVMKYAHSKLPDGDEHDEFREFLEYFAEDEAGHDLLALEDLEALGFDGEACSQTLPLPTTMNLQGNNFLAIDKYGPYFILGETYATETTGAEISAEIYDAYATDEDAARGAQFYDVHGEADIVHAERSEECLKNYLPDHRDVITLGCLTAWRNLMAMANEVKYHRLYPERFQLVSK